MKKFLAKLLLKRGAHWLHEAGGKAIRHGLSTLGGVMIGAGAAAVETDTLSTIEGGALALLGLGISLARIKVQAWLEQNSI